MQKILSEIYPRICTQWLNYQWVSWHANHRVPLLRLIMTGYINQSTGSQHLKMQ